MKKRHFLGILFCFFYMPLSAKQFYFKKYQVETGLSHNTVSCVLQDSYGFMWFGTSDGLNRFDGKKFKIYRNEMQDKFSLGNNFIQILFEDDESNIWVGTNSGIYIYSRSNEHFTHFKKETEYGVSISSEVKKIIKTSNRKIWIATLGQGIFIYDMETGILKQNSKYTSFVWDICEDRMQRVYSSSLQEGLICYDLNGKYIESFTPFIDRQNMENLKINCLYAIDDKVWFGAGTNSLSVLDIKTKRISSYYGNMNIGTVRAIISFSETELFIGSDNGLYLFNIFDKQFVRIDNPADLRSLSDHYVMSIVKDTEGGFWISTYIGGVNYLAPQTKAIEYYFPTYSLVSSIGKVINRFCEAKDGNIWVGAQDGLKLLHTDMQKLESYPFNQRMQKLDIRSLLLDDDNLWVGTYSEGLKIINLKTNRIEEHYHFRESTQTICSNDVLSLFMDSKKNIYAGTSRGLCRYNRSRNNFEALNFVGSMTSVFDILEDSKGFLWIATDNSGVFRYNSNTSQWKHYFHDENDSSSIISNSIISLFEDSNDKIWLGTNGAGLCYFNENSETFSDFDPHNKILPNKVIYSMEEDNVGNFWISTNAGLLRINPSNSSKQKLYTKEHGLQSNQFNFKASLKSSAGKLYFGGINGFNAFFPDEFEENAYIPPVYIVDIRLYNTNDREAKKILNLSEQMYIAKKITLPYANNSIAFEFAALSYEEPDRNKYRYILEGFDMEWVNNEHSNTAFYTKLPPGEYTFKVKGSNNDNRWNEQGAEIQLVIMPPWYRSMLAFVFYILFVAVIIYLIIMYLIHRSKKRFRMQLEEYRIEKEKEVYASKIRFFINLVHEVRTPLSLIKLPLDKLTEKYSTDPNQAKYLNIINKNVLYLFNVVNQLLDFQKIENQETKLNLKWQSLNSLLQDIYRQFVHVAEMNHIKVTVSLPENEPDVLIDKEKIEKIIINLMSNALKFTGTKIDLRLEYEEDGFKIMVADDGPGIPNEEKEKIFEAFYQVNEEDSGTGIGLAFSKLLAEKHKGNISLSDNPEGGTTFVLSLPFEFDETEHVADGESNNEKKDADDSKEDVSLKYSILLVEDNIELLNLMEESLSPHFTVFKSNNAEKALSILSRKNVDIVISDIMMSGMNGLELCKNIKSDPSQCHIPVILLTAKATLDSKIEGMEYGAEAYIEKPFSIKYLQKQIENLLKLKTSIRQAVANYPFLNPSNLTVSERDREFIEKLQAEIEKHISDPEFSINSVAKVLYMSRSSFYRNLGRIANMSPHDYLRAYRLHRAAELLLQGESVLDICYKVAFGSTSYFAKCFKLQFGVLPKDYIASMQSKS
ncbi:MAG: response regulator [Dysgonamonadaceae bacterium]|jgi:signal transduction histidine kinase/ligand-binding sensor domain-containing protein/DNA-binding response OmpR family regulator|nr:response regulator [Dysgonamonadaceae bacterium]